MEREEIRQILFNVPEVAGWPELAAPLAQALTHPRHDWELPLIACRAVGGDNQVIARAATALVCVQLCITLVDDMLDQDPRGFHLQIGEGATANVSLALQALAFSLVENIPVDAEYRVAVTASLSRMALATAYGQSLDVQNLEGEENYWKIVRAKSTPFYVTVGLLDTLRGYIFCA
jgi:geranylgeranyl pyrophosphate synthase